MFVCASWVSNVKPVCDCEYGAVREQQAGVKIEMENFRLKCSYCCIKLF